MLCFFKEPINLNTTTTPDFEYSVVECSTTDEIIYHNASSGVAFSLDKSLSYGDIIIFTFLFWIIIMSVVKFFLENLLKKQITAKK